MIELTIDGKKITVPKGTTVYAAAKQHGIEIPIFCYHERMPPFGACRMCLVEVEKMGKLQTSCTLEATDGMVVHTKSQQAEKGQEEIVELLLINHPLDCPICDRGGECPLQDNTMKHGPGKSRFVEEKRHFPKPIPLGPVLMLDRERCIACARCTRFCDIVSGDHALEFKERGYRTEVGTPEGGTAESKFIGNTIMICPVGALTSEVYRFRARPWDNDHVESSCTLCPVGCSLYFDSRDGEIVRTRARENPAVNDMWMCDKGWFGYEYTSHKERLQQPLIRDKATDQLKPATWEEAFTLIVDKIAEAKPRGKLAALGGNPLTFEENLLFQKLMREGAGVDHIDHRVGTPHFTLAEEKITPGMKMPLEECERLDFALILGCDLTEEFPVVWLRLRQAINRGATVIFLGHYAPEISTHLKKTVLHTPGQEIEMLKKYLPQVAQHASYGVGAVFVGSQYLNSEQRKEILTLLERFCSDTPNIALNIMEGRGNSMGARKAGMRPDLTPTGALQQSGLDAVAIIEESAAHGWDFLYVAGADIVKKYPQELWRKARAQLGFMIVQDLFLTETAQQADVVLPTLSYVEKEGSFVNIEGRTLHLKPGKELPENVFSDREIFSILLEKLQARGITTQPHTKFRRDAKTEKTAHSDVGDLRATFAYALFDEGVRMKHNEHLYQMVKEPLIRLHPLEASKRKLAAGSAVTVSKNGQSITGKLKIDERVAGGTVVIPVGFDDLPAYELGPELRNGLFVWVTAAKENGEKRSW